MPDYTEEDGLLPCPFCGHEAVAGTVDDGEDRGGHFIQCTNGMCGASTNLRFAHGDDPRLLLVEQWNRRSPDTYTAGALAMKEAAAKECEDIRDDTELCVVTANCCAECIRAQINTERENWKRWTEKAEAELTLKDKVVEAARSILRYDERTTNRPPYSMWQALQSALNDLDKVIAR